MIIAIDEAIPHLQTALAPLGEIRPFTGRSEPKAEVRDADALIVRSVTRVDAGLLEGSSVRFVGTVTVGMDHLDLEYLGSRRIRFANAAGCNSIAVSEWVVAALLEFADRREWDLATKTIGIIGAGHIGSLVEKKAAVLGLRVTLCDPPLFEATGDRRYGTLESVLGADILTLHVPLVTDGRNPTFHMIGEDVLKRLSDRQLLINSSRGEVVDGTSLKHALQNRRIAGALIDVWEREPEIDGALLAQVDLGTVHIAGSSRDAKVRGTQMIFEELCRFFDVSPAWGAAGQGLSPRPLQVPFGAEGQQAVRSIVRQAYDIMKDDAALRALPLSPTNLRVVGFDKIRDGYVLRNEFSHFVAEVPPAGGLDSQLPALGFHVTHPADRAGRR